MAACADPVHSGKNDTSEQENVPAYSGTFDGYMYFEKYQDSLYLVREMYFDDLQPYILNESDFCNLIADYVSVKEQADTLPEIQNAKYISDYDALKEKNRYRIVYSVDNSSDEDLQALKESISDFEFEVAFSDASITEKNEYIQKLAAPVRFELLNEGNEIEMD